MVWLGLLLILEETCPENGPGHPEGVAQPRLAWRWGVGGGTPPSPTPHLQANLTWDGQPLWDDLASVMGDISTVISNNAAEDKQDIIFSNRTEQRNSRMSGRRGLLKQHKLTDDQQTAEDQEDITQQRTVRI